MKLLLDECVPASIRRDLIGHECKHTTKVGFSGKKNGELLTAAEQAGFDVLVTVDRHISSQQNMKGRGISLLVICAASNKRDDVLEHVPAALLALCSIKPGQVIRIG